MTKEMHDDDRIYRDMAGLVSKPDLLKVRKVTQAWADALDKMSAEDTNLRIVFLACVNTIGVMGPAYCRLAATNLLLRAKDYD
jgi:hypothetical protein